MTNIRSFLSFIMFLSILLASLLSKTKDMQLKDEISVDSTALYIRKERNTNLELEKSSDKLARQVSSKREYSTEHTQYLHNRNKSTRQHNRVKRAIRPAVVKGKPMENVYGGTIIDANVTIEDKSVFEAVTRYDTCRDGVRIDTCARQRFCFCDSDCTIHNDCCIDAKPQPMSTERYKLVQSVQGYIQCEELSKRQFFKVISLCPNETSNTDLKQKCENVNKTDTISMVPAYDATLKLSFRNMYCAQCQNIDVNVNGLQYWKVFIRKCTDFLPSVMKYGLWNFLSQLHPDCDVVVVAPDDIRKMRCLDYYDDNYVCYGHVTTTASQLFSPTTGSAFKRIEGAKNNETNTDIANIVATTLPFTITERYPFDEAYLVEVCKKYLNIYGVGRRGYRQSYRNPLCSWCINDQFELKSCSDRLIGVTALTSLSVLINFQEVVVSKRSATLPTCAENEVVDSYSGICRKLECNGLDVPYYGQCITAYSASNDVTLVVAIMVTSRDFPIKLLDRAIREDVISIMPQLYMHDMRTEFEDQQNSTDDVLSRKCVEVSIKQELSMDNIYTLVGRYKYLFYYEYTDATDTLRISSVVSPFEECSSYLQKYYDETLPCPYISIDTDNGTMGPLLLHFQSLKKDFIENFIYKEVENTLHICYETFQSLTTRLTSHSTGVYEEKQTVLKAVLSICLVSVSLVLLIASIAIYVLHPDFKTTPCRITLNIMLCLCGSYVMFLLSNIMDPNTLECRIVAVLAQAMWLTVFSWSTIYGFHTAKLFWTVNTKHATKSQQRHRLNLKIVIYGILAYSFSIVFTSVTVVLDVLGLFEMEYGRSVCYIGNGHGLLLGIGLSLCLMVACNSICLVVSFIKMWDLSIARRKLQIVVSCAKMMTCLSLSWSFGIMAGFANLEPLWYAHIVLNGSQGIFIFVSYILCSTSVRGWLKQKCHASGVDDGNEGPIGALACSEAKEGRVNNVTSSSTNQTTDIPNFEQQM